MTKNEALNKIKELEDYIKSIDNPIGFEDDEIFLLSTKEYEKYKNVISSINNCWWLRSPGSIQNYAAGVHDVGSVYYFGDRVISDNGCVRPAIKTFKNTYNVGDIICSAGYTWVVIDRENGIAIAEMPIAVRCFDSKFNNYKTSEIRKWLLKWYRDRSKEFNY